MERQACPLIQSIEREQENRVICLQEPREN